MDINYFMKIQNAYGTKNRREKDLAKINNEMSKHFEDTFDTEEVLLNDIPTNLMIIKDTDGNTNKKKIKSKHNDKFNIGDYVKWDGQIWLITLVDSDNKTWNRGYMYLCTVPLRWINNEGKIIERWAYAEDFTKYSSGVTGNGTINIGDNQYGLTIPIDNETKQLHRDMRFPIDFDDSKNPDVYRLTNKKAHLSNNTYFGRGGTITLTLSYGTFNKNSDKKVTLENGQNVWICDYVKSSTPPPTQRPSNEMTDLSAVISGNTNLRNSYKRTYAVEFKNKSGDIIDWNEINFNWNIISNFNVNKNEYGNKVELLVNNENLIGFSFLLQIIIDNKTATEIQVNIVE